MGTEVLGWLYLCDIVWKMESICVLFRAQIPNRIQPARLAQSVERETLNLKVAGSRPALGSIPNAPNKVGRANFYFYFFIFIFIFCWLLYSATCI